MNDVCLIDISFVEEKCNMYVQSRHYDIYNCVIYILHTSLKFTKNVRNIPKAMVWKVCTKILLQKSVTSYQCCIKHLLFRSNIIVRRAKRDIDFEYLAKCIVTFERYSLRLIEMPRELIITVYL